MLAKEDVCIRFKELSSAKRIDLLCGMLQMCLPLERRFLGSFLEELCRLDFQALRSGEIGANDRMELGGMTCNLLNQSDRSQLSVVLSLLYSTNSPCSNIIHGILVNRIQEVIKYVESNCDGSVIDLDNLYADVMLILTMVTNHPAFTFSQKYELSQYTIDFESLLNKLGVGAQKASQVATDTASECTCTGCRRRCIRAHKHHGQEKAVYVKSIQLVKNCRSQQTAAEKGYNIKVTWSNDVTDTVLKSYDDLRLFHHELTRKFPKDAGAHRQSRQIPFFPQEKGNRDDLWEQMAKYVRGLQQMPGYMLQDDVITHFLKSRDAAPEVSDEDSDTATDSPLSPAGVMGRPSNLNKRDTSPKDCESSSSGVKSDDEAEESSNASPPLKSQTFYNSAFKTGTGGSQSPQLHSKPPVLNARQLHGSVQSLAVCTSPLASSPMSSPYISPSASLYSGGSRSSSPSTTGRQKFTIPTFLKKLRLHKYSEQMAQLTVPEFLKLADSDLEKYGLTKGAMGKFRTGVDKLRSGLQAENGGWYCNCDLHTDSNSPTVSLSSPRNTLSPQPVNKPPVTATPTSDQEYSPEPHVSPVLTSMPLHPVPGSSLLTLAQSPMVTPAIVAVPSGNNSILAIPNAVSPLLPGTGVIALNSPIAASQSVLPTNIVTSLMDNNHVIHHSPVIGSNPMQPNSVIPVSASGMLVAVSATPTQQVPSPVANYVTGPDVRRATLVSGKESASLYSLMVQPEDSVRRSASSPAVFSLAHDVTQETESIMTSPEDIYVTSPNSPSDDAENVTLVIQDVRSTNTTKSNSKKETKNNVARRHNDKHGNESKSNCEDSILSKEVSIGERKDRIKSMVDSGSSTCSEDYSSPAASPQLSETHSQLSDSGSGKSNGVKVPFQSYKHRSKPRYSHNNDAQRRNSSSGDISSPIMPGSGLSGSGSGFSSTGSSSSGSSSKDPSPRLPLQPPPGGGLLMRQPLHFFSAPPPPPGGPAMGHLHHVRSPRPMLSAPNFLAGSRLPNGLHLPPPNGPGAGSMGLVNGVNNGNVGYTTHRPSSLDIMHSFPPTVTSVTLTDSMKKNPSLDTKRSGSTKDGGVVGLSNTSNQTSTTFTTFKSHSASSSPVLLHSGRVPQSASPCVYCGGDASSSSGSRDCSECGSSSGGDVTSVSSGNHSAPPQPANMHRTYTTYSVPLMHHVHTYQQQPPPPHTPPTPPHPLTPHSFTPFPPPHLSTHHHHHPHAPWPQSNGFISPHTTYNGAFHVGAFPPQLASQQQQLNGFAAPPNGSVGVNGGGVADYLYQNNFGNPHPHAASLMTNGHFVPLPPQHMASSAQMTSSQPLTSYQQQLLNMSAAGKPGAKPLMRCCNCGGPGHRAYECGEATMESIGSYTMKYAPKSETVE